MNETEQMEKLKEEHAESMKELQNTMEIKTLFLGKGIAVRNVLSPSSKRPTVTIDISDLSQVGTILSAFPPEEAWYIDNQVTTSLRKWEEQIVVRHGGANDGEKITRLQSYKEDGKFWELHNGIELDTSPQLNHQDVNIKVRWEHVGYCIWLDIPYGLLDADQFEVREEVSEYHTREKYQHCNISPGSKKYQPVMQKCYQLKHTLNMQERDGIVRINFYGGHKKHVFTTPEGTARLMVILELGKWPKK